MPRFIQPRCDNCQRFVPFQYGPNESEWWAGGFCAPGKGCQSAAPHKGAIMRHEDVIIHLLTLKGSGRGYGPWLDVAIAMIGRLKEVDGAAHEAHTKEPEA